MYLTFYNNTEMSYYIRGFLLLVCVTLASCQVDVISLTSSYVLRVNPDGNEYPIGTTGQFSLQELMTPGMTLVYAFLSHFDPPTQTDAQVDIQLGNMFDYTGDNGLSVSFEVGSLATLPTCVLAVSPCHTRTAVNWTSVSTLALNDLDMRSASVMVPVPSELGPYFAVTVRVLSTAANWPVPPSLKITFQFETTTECTLSQTSMADMTFTGYYHDSNSFTSFTTGLIGFTDQTVLALSTENLVPDPWYKDGVVDILLEVPAASLGVAPPGVVLALRLTLLRASKTR
jgi:hypothetical protein